MKTEVALRISAERRGHLRNGSGIKSLLIHTGYKNNTSDTKINLKCFKSLNILGKKWRKYSIIKGNNFLNKTHTKKNSLFKIFKFCSTNYII